MPLPRANISGLGAHVSSMVSDPRSYLFGRGDRESKSKTYKSDEFISKEDDDSEASEDSDSEIEDNEGSGDFLSKINAATAARKAKTAPAPSSPTTKMTPQKIGTKATIAASPPKSVLKSGLLKDAPNGSANGTPAAEPPKTNGVAKKSTETPTKPPTIKPSPAKKPKQEPADDDESTSSSGSSSDDNDEGEEASKKKSTKSKATAKATAIKSEPKDDNESSSSEDSSDSDDSEGEGAGAKLSAKDVKKEAKKEESSSESEEDSSDPSSSGSDSESDSDSESESDSEDGAVKKTKPKSKAKAAPSKSSKIKSESDSSSGSSSSEEDSSSSEEEKEAPRNSKSSKSTAAKNKSKKDKPHKDKSQTKRGKGKIASGPEGSESSERGGESSGDETGSGSSSSSEASDQEIADESFALVQGSSTVNSKVLDEYVREGFQLRKAAHDVTAQEVVKMFKNARQEGKQIWYFTTPSSVPISVVETMEFPMSDAQSGKAIVSHNGVDFGVDLEAGGKPSSFKILVPVKDGGKYKIIDNAVDHTMHLKRVTLLAPADLTAKPTQQVTFSKTPRPQPPVLKARFTPIGVPSPRPILHPVHSSSSRSTDVSMIDAPSGPGTATPKSPKKRKMGVAEDEVKMPSTQKKPKKLKTETADAAPASKTLVKVTPIAPPLIGVSSSQPIKKTSPAPLPISADRAPSLSQPVASSSSGKKDKRQGRQPNGVVNTPAAARSSKVNRTKSMATPSRTQTPVPLPKLPGLK